MFEDVTKPPPESRMTPWRFPPWYWKPEDSFEASWNARLFCALAFLGVAADAGTHGTTNASLAVRDAGALLLIALAWIFRSPAAAALAAAMSPLFLLGGTGHAGLEGAKGSANRSLAFALLVGGSYATWACIQYRKFRQLEEAPPSPGSEDGLNPS